MWASLYCAIMVCGEGNFNAALGLFENNVYLCPRKNTLNENEEDTICVSW